MTNVRTIRMLLSQSEELRKLVSDSAAVSIPDETKQLLQIQISKIEESITNLVENTEKLFSAYEHIVDSQNNS